MKHNKIEKPKAIEDQVDTIWDFLFNQLNHKVNFLDVKISFILAFLALLMILVSIVLIKS